MKAGTANQEVLYTRVLARIFSLGAKHKLKIPARASAEVYLLPNPELRALKRKYLKRNVKVVDILSFPENDAFPDPEGKRKLGEIYINRVIAARDPQRGIFLLIHGFLHLLGFLHELKRDRIKMEKIECEIYDELIKKLPNNFPSSWRKYPPFSPSNPRI